jgi:hypothetical protein
MPRRGRDAQHGTRTSTIALGAGPPPAATIVSATTQRLQLGGCQGCHPGIVRRSRRTTSQSIPSVTAQATHNPRPIHHSRCDPSIVPTTKAIGPMVPAIPATSQKAQWAHGGCRSHGRRMETVFPNGWASSTEWLTVVNFVAGRPRAGVVWPLLRRQGAPRDIRSRSHLATRDRADRTTASATHRSRQAPPPVRSLCHKRTHQRERPDDRLRAQLRAPATDSRCAERGVVRRRCSGTRQQSSYDAGWLPLAWEAEVSSPRLLRR